jgi:hypothetical protein
MIALGSASSCFLKTSSSRLLSISLLSISARPVASLMRASPFVLSRTGLRVRPGSKVRRSQYPMPPTAGQTEDLLAAYFLEDAVEAKFAEHPFHALR